MVRRILITGGAGFVGSHLADALLARGDQVRALDSLEPQVHGPERRRPRYLAPEVELTVGDVRDPDTVRKALEGVDAVYHFAAAVGVGQSMYQIARYTSVNTLGTAVLMEALIRHPVERLVVASSMSLYGEGLYRAPDGSRVEGRERSLERLKARKWEVTDEQGRVLLPLPTPETKTPALPSIYALSKFDQERMCLTLGRAYGIPTVALRFFNIFGARQALSNPYTGVLAIFASRYLNGRAPLINEDGHQRRDFVSVHDVVQACRLALEVPQAVGQVFNVGSGRNYSVLEIAHALGTSLGGQHPPPEIVGKYRMGDIRHCFADITQAREVLGYAPRVSLEEGLRELTEWLRGELAEDRVERAREELAAQGLAV